VGNNKISLEKRSVVTRLFWENEMHDTKTDDGRSPDCSKGDELGKAVLYAGPREYLCTLDDLYRVSLADLGPMDQKDYQEFMDEARAICEKAGISKPAIMLDLQMKDGLMRPYPPIESEWQSLISTLDLCKEVPHVHVVDGSRYTAPI